MKDFGTFDTLSDEEDRIYNRLAIIHRELDRLDYDRNDAGQEIKMWRNKMLDDKFKVKFWLVIALIFGFFSLPWYKLILLAVPPGVEFAYGYLFNVLATFIMMICSFIMLPLFIITDIVFLVWLIITILRNGKSDRILKLAEIMGVSNRNVLIGEQIEVIKNNTLEEEALKTEEEKLKKRLREIQREETAD